MKLTITVAALAILVISSSVHAQDLTEEQCDKATTTVEMTACVARDLETADETLNEVYEFLIEKLEQSEIKGARQKLVEAQRAWIMFRDAECDFYSFTWTGGSGYYLQKNGCLLTETEKRTETLKMFLENWPDI